MTARVLVLSFEDDFHARAIAALLRQRGADADIVDIKDFPSSLRFAFACGADEATRLAGRALDDYRSVWWRRVRTPRPADDVTNTAERAFAVREATDAMWGALHAARIPIYNDPAAEAVASYKPYQLSRARAAGLAVPETVVTNDPAEVLRFRERCDGEVIFKSLSATTLRLTETRPLDDAALEHLPRLAHAPAIFQEYVPYGREYRVSYVAGRLFAAEIAITREAARYDWRIDCDYETLPSTLDGDTAAKLTALMDDLGLASGAIDLRETPDGQVYFLEVNPSGQFLFLDVFAGMNVADAFCDMLLREP